MAKCSTRARAARPTARRSTALDAARPHCSPAAARARTGRRRARSRRAIPGTCRAGPTKPGRTARRFRVSDRPIHFDDLFQGTAGFRPDYLRRRGGRTPRRSRELSARGGGRRRIPGRDARGARRGSAGEHARGRSICRRAGHCRRPIYGHLPLLVEPDGTKLSKSSACGCRSIRHKWPKGLHRPLRICPRCHPRNWAAVVDKRGVELGSYALAPTSACGQAPRCAVRSRRHVSRNRDGNCEVAAGVLRYLPTRRVKA